MANPQRTLAKRKEGSCHPCRATRLWIASRTLIDLTSDHIQRREDHWAIVDLVGKAGHVRTVPMPEWVKRTIDEWLNAADISQGKLFRCVSRKGTVWGTEKPRKWCGTW